MHGMRPFGDLLAHEEAVARLLAAASPVTRTEELPLLAAAGRVCAADVLSPVAVPPFDRATMDGYALASKDAAAAGAVLRVVGTAHAGNPFGGRLGPGEAVRIATGAPVPDGADSVVKVEDTSESSSGVTLRTSTAAGRFIDRAGSDIEAGAVVVARGAVLTPARLGLLASIGMASVAVVARPRVALHASGDELLKPGDAPRAGAIFDANSTSLSALLTSAGADVVPSPPLPDSLESLTEALRKSAASCDMVVISGGASVGERDHAADALRSVGTVLFHGVKVKPGKPLLAGIIGRAMFIGLPGNPTSALSNAAIFILPALARMSGVEHAGSRSRARLAAPVVGEPDRFLFLPVRLADGAAHPTFKGSGALTSLAESDGWVGIPAGTTLDAGADVVVHAW